MFGFYAFSATAFSGLPPVIYSEIVSDAITLSDTAATADEIKVALGI